MSLRLYNTLSRTVEDFKPLAPPAVTMYVCGPTVYDDPHIGHARSAFVFDVLRRYLEYRQFRVTFVRNVTDVDDKIIAKAQQEQEVGRREKGVGDLKDRCQEVAERYLKSYHSALEQLGISAPSLEPRATQEIDAMLDLISELVVKGAAYEAKGHATGTSAGRDVYFAVRKFPGYGRLSNRSVDELQTGARVEPGEQKQDPLDFALWKAAKPGEPSWKSPWGAGRPGWHIECSAMSTKHLGDQFDIHGGGVDLVFPHHENEIAQAQAAGKPFAKVWIHNGLLTVNGEKMSKSLGNFITVEQALASCNGTPDVLKVFFLGAHYRSPIDYSARSLQAALGRYRRMVNFYHRVMNRDLPDKSAGPPFESAQAWHDALTSAMDDDLNTPRALAALDGLVAEGYAASDSLARVAAANTLFQLGKTFGLFHGLISVQLNQEQQQLLRKREEARQRKDFSAADQIRNSFAANGLTVEDTPEGPVVLPKR